MGLNGGPLLRIVTATMCLMVTFPVLAGTWTTQTVDVGSAASLAYDPIDRNPSIAYITGWGDKTKTAKFAHWDGTRWVIEVIGPMNGNDIQLAYNTVTGQPAVAYGGPYTKGKYPLIFSTRPPTGGWTKEVVDAAAGYGSFSLAFDQAGVPGIAYILGTKTTATMYYTRKGGASWSKQTVITGPSGTASDVSLAYDPASNPAIAHQYTDGRTTFCLRLQHWNGSSWNKEDVECGPYEPQHAWGNFPSLAYAPGGEPAIASEGGGSAAGWPRYSRKSGTWATEVIDQSATATFALSLAFTPAGVPYVSFVIWDDPVPDELRVAHLEGTTWVTELVAAGTISAYSSLAIDSSGEPSVAYSTGELKFARRTTP